MFFQIRYKILYSSCLNIKDNRTLYTRYLTLIAGSSWWMRRNVPISSYMCSLLPMWWCCSGWSVIIWALSCDFPGGKLRLHLIRRIRAWRLSIWVSCLINALRSVRRYRAFGLRCSNSPYKYSEDLVIDAEGYEAYHFSAIRICCTKSPYCLDIISERMVFICVQTNPFSTADTGCRILDGFCVSCSLFGLAKD